MIDLDTLYGILILLGAIALCGFVIYHGGKVPDGSIVGDRARKDNGRFVADKKCTPDWNEAYIGGKRVVKRKNKAKTAMKAEGKPKINARSRKKTD